MALNNGVHRPPTKKVAPDGGWGWMACFGVSLVNLATRSIEPSFGLLFGDILRDLQISTTGASVIMSTLDVCMNFSGLFVGPLLHEFSYRKVAVGGSLLCALGMALTAPAASMAHILATYSVINGIGVGLATSAAFVALNHYFKEKRGQAVGLSMAGTAIGMLILPQLVRILLEAFDFQGAVLVLSGLALHAAAGSMLLQPVKRHLIEVPVDVELNICVDSPSQPPIFRQESTDCDDGGQQMNGKGPSSSNGTSANGTTTTTTTAKTPLHAFSEEDGELPEMTNLLRFDANKKMRKNFSELAISSMNRPAMLRNSQQRMPRNLSVTASSQAQAAGNGLMPDLSSAVRRRRVSVMSHLSLLDFSGSNVHVHMNIGDEEAVEQDQAIRRVNTVLAMSSMPHGGSSAMDSLANSKLMLGSVHSSDFRRPGADGGLFMSPAGGAEANGADALMMGSLNGAAPTTSASARKLPFWRRCFALLDVSLLRDGHFLVLLLGLSLFYVAEMNFKMVTPFFLASLKFHKSDVAFCLSMAAISDIGARLVVPPICDRLHIRKKLVFSVSIVFVLITRSIMAEQTERSGIIIWLCISGFFRGSALANFTLTVSEYCSLEKLPAAFGWHMIGKAVFVVALGPLIGAIRDMTDSYPLCIHAQSVCIGLCCLVWIVEYVYDLLANRQKKPKSVPPLA